MPENPTTPGDNENLDEAAQQAEANVQPETTDNAEATQQAAEQADAERPEVAEQRAPHPETR
jgi:hypothetical protein